MNFLTNCGRPLTLLLHSLVTWNQAFFIHNTAVAFWKANSKADGHKRTNICLKTFNLFSSCLQSDLTIHFIRLIMKLSFHVFFARLRKDGVLSTNQNQTDCNTQSSLIDFFLLFKRCFKADYLLYYSITKGAKITHCWSRWPLRPNSPGTFWKDVAEVLLRVDKLPCT